MAEYSGFFDAHLVNGEYDRVYLAEHFAKYFASFIGNGIFGGKSNELFVKQKDVADMSVKVLSGQGFINGYFYENTDDLSLAIDNADGVLSRIDLIVLRWNKYDRVIRLAVEKGSPSSSPSAPLLKRNDDYYELELAKVQINAGATRITQTDITDMRLDSDVCGFVVGLIDQFDTKEFDAQLKAWFEMYKLDSITRLNELLVEINEIIAANDLSQILADIQTLYDSTVKKSGGSLSGRLFFENYNEYHSIIKGRTLTDGSTHFFTLGVGTSGCAAFEHYVSNTGKYEDALLDGRLELNAAIIDGISNAEALVLKNNFSETGQKFRIYGDHYSPMVVATAELI